MSKHDFEPLPPGVPRYTQAVREGQLPKPPFFLIAIGLVSVIASWVPLSLAARGRFNQSSEPRLHIMQDMGTQPKYREQQTSTIFADGRADRPHVVGTVARGGLQEDDHLYRGYSTKDLGDGKFEAKFFAGFPQQIKLTEDFVKRGQERFNIYCSACHGLDGYGHGPVNERALELQNNGASGMSWTPAANLQEAAVRNRPEGHIYNTINVGIRAMPGYGSQIPMEDRWAIVAYVRALQLSQNAPPKLADPAKLTEAK